MNLRVLTLSVQYHSETHIITNESTHDKTHKMACAPTEDRSAWASAQADQSLRCPHEERLGPLLLVERTAETLIRLRGCQGCSESSLGAHHFVGFVVSWLKCYETNQTTKWQSESRAQETINWTRTKMRLVRRQASETDWGGSRHLVWWPTPSCN